MEMEQGSLELFKSNSNRYIIKFDTAKEAIDAETLANALSAYKHTVLSLASEQRDSEELFVDVDVVNKGCVEIHTILTVIQSCINPETLPTIVASIKHLVDLYKFLKGKPAKKVAPDNSKGAVNKVVITNADNVNITINQNVYETYVNSDTPPFGDSRKYAKDKISSVRFLDENKKEYVRIDKADFASFEKGRHRVDDDDIKDVEEELELVVTKVPLGAPKNQWCFINNSTGTQIKAKIKDDEFIAKVERHDITFGKGDRIRAKVLTHNEFDPSLKCVVVKSTTILRVLE